MLARKNFPELQTKLCKTSKCGFEGSREIQSICNRKLIGKKFEVLQLRLVVLFLWYTLHVSKWLAASV